ncbi:protein AroM [Paenibacillus sophorae]|uniref:AroM family protein n=1 Tax=Paenibacillus sophorae TaxID=1333845 RepID=A0A1H8PB58_9BACL|nr:AroM family protein [Paenibacillus sophorae]QWU16512.1 AroM family protein [Paenibacillus sophorae]SEO39219.1 protein AroM [Paenibacillus sophorae]
MIRTGFEASAALGMITIGQAPRNDVAPYLLRQLEGRARLIQAGVLDGWSEEEIKAKLAPGPGDYALTSRLADGGAAVVARDKVLPILQGKIDAMEVEGIRQILLLCTGVFPGLRTRSSFLIEPDRILTPAVAALVGGRRLGVICPLEEQADSLMDKFAEYGLRPVFAEASPYTGEEEDFGRAAGALQGRADVLLLDCMGYTERHRESIARASGLPVILSNTLMSKLVSEILA